MNELTFQFVGWSAVCAVLTTVLIMRTVYRRERGCIRILIWIALLVWWFIGWSVFFGWPFYEFMP